MNLIQFILQSVCRLWQIVDTHEQLERNTEHAIFKRYERSSAADNEIQRDNRFIYHRRARTIEQGKQDLGRIGAWDLYTYEELSLAVWSDLRDWLPVI